MIIFGGDRRVKRTGPKHFWFRPVDWKLRYKRRRGCTCTGSFIRATCPYPHAGIQPKTARPLSQRKLSAEFRKRSAGHRLYAERDSLRGTGIGPFGQPTAPQFPIRRENGIRAFFDQTKKFFTKPLFNKAGRKT